MFHRTGTSAYTHELVQHLRRQNPGDSVVLFARNQRMGGGSYHEISYAERAANFIYKQYRLPRELADHHIDIYHSPRDMGLPRPRQLPCPSVMTLHDIILVRLALDYYSPARARMYEKRLLPRVREVDQIITISRFSKQDIVEWSGVPADRVSVVYDGVSERFSPVTDDARLSAVRLKYRLPHEFILCMGSTEPRKNTRTAIEAYARLRELRPGIQLVVSGTDYCRLTPQQAFAGMDLDGVLFPGYIEDDDMPALYSMAQALLFLSLYEGFGLPPLEAMACGTPVVAADATSIPEISGDAAILVNPRDPIQVAAALDMLLSSADLREEMIARGIEKAASYSWSETARQTREIYEQVVSRHGG